MPAILIMTIISVVYVFKKSESEKKDPLRLGANFTACDYEPDFLKQLGFENKKACQLLHEALWNQIVDNCTSPDYTSPKLDQQTSKSFVSQCEYHSLSLERLAVLKEYVIYNQKIERHS